MEKFKRIMVVDDDPVNNTIVRKLAEFTGFAEEVISFVSAVDGLDYLQQTLDKKEDLPSIIFLDIRMPIVNGWDFLERVSEMNRLQQFDNVHIYMLTSSSEQSDINKARQYKMVTDYIVKPLTQDKLASIRNKEEHLTVD